MQIDGQERTDILVFYRRHGRVLLGFSAGNMNFGFRACHHLSDHRKKVILGLYWDERKKENGNYYIIMGYIWGLYPATTMSPSASLDAKGHPRAGLGQDAVTW